MVETLERYLRKAGVSPSDALWGTSSAFAVGLLAAVFATNFSLGRVADTAIHPITMGILLSICCVPLVRWAVGDDAALMRIAAGGFVAKCVGTYLRFTLTGNGDNQAYHSAGARISGWLHESVATPANLPEHFGDTGTDWMSYMVGWLYYFTGPRRVTAFVVFAFLSFVGTLLFYRAATQAIPELDKKRYALLLFFMPSIFFWPSTIGKEAWMIGFLGLASLGVSGLSRHRLTTGYLIALGGGLLIAGRVRPHVGALVLVAFVAALVWPTGSRGNRFRQVGLLVIGIVALSFAMGQVADFFRADRAELNPILDYTQGRTSEGGSQFSPVRITGPWSLVPGALSVVFRPFITEARTILQFLGGLESLGLVALLVVSRHRIRRLPRLFLTNVYVRFATFYSLGFVVAFSVVSNFGILTRQRAQLWPIFLILLALMPPPSESPDVGADESSDDLVGVSPP